MEQNSWDASSLSEISSKTVLAENLSITYLGGIPLAELPPADVRGISGCMIAVVVSFSETRLGVVGAEGVGDALVGGFGLAVDPVGVDFQQDLDAVPGAVGHLGRRHPRVQPQRHGRVAQVVGTVADRRPALRWRQGRNPQGLLTNLDATDYR
jgi:hypothetical protein